MSKEGDEILDGRQATYGDRKKNMQTMSDMYNAYLDGVEIRNGERRIEAFDFPMLMLLYKVYRFAVTPTYADNINDIDGYSAMAREMLGDSLIEAATAQEYQEKLEESRKGMPQAPIPGVRETLQARCFNLGHTYTEDQTVCVACGWKKEDESIENGFARLAREAALTQKMPQEGAKKRTNKFEGVEYIPDFSYDAYVPNEELIRKIEEGSGNPYANVEACEEDAMNICQSCYGWYTNPNDTRTYNIQANQVLCEHPRHIEGRNLRRIRSNDK